MKKTILFFAAMVFCVAPMLAQLTLTQTSFATAPLGADSVSSSYSNSGVPQNISDPGDNFSLDFSSMAYFYIDTPFVIHYAYPGYTYQEFAVHPIKLPNLYFDARSLFNVDQTGIKKSGEAIEERGYSLNGAPGALATDSIVFPAQIDTYSAPQTKIAFPATTGAVWSSSLRSSVAFITSYAGILTQQPCTYVSYITETDSVIASGQVTVKRADNTPSASIPVIDVQVSYHQVDSFFYGNTAFPTAMLSLFGLTQGLVTDAYDHKFYREGETTPLVDVSFADNTYSYTGVTRTYVHTQRLSPAAVPQVTAANAIQVYPNPVDGRTFTLVVPAAFTGTTTYSIVNIAGQEVAADKIKNTGNALINVPATATAGTYFVRLCNNGQQVSIVPLEVR